MSSGTSKAWSPPPQDETLKSFEDVNSASMTFSSFQTIGPTLGAICSILLASILVLVPMDRAILTENANAGTAWQ